jgi:hypothetical protein
MFDIQENTTITGLGTEWTKISNESDIKSLIHKDKNKEGKITTKNIKDVTSERKEYLIVKDVNLKPTSIHFKYNDHWAKEDSGHFHTVLRKYNEDVPLEQYDNPTLLTGAFQNLKRKHLIDSPKNKSRAVKAVMREQEEDFTIDSEEEYDPEFKATIITDIKAGFRGIKPSKRLETLPGRTIDQVLYDDFKAKYVKVIHLSPLKIVWDNRRFCQSETISTRTLDKLRQQGIGIESLKKNDPQAYYNAFNRCYDVGNYEHEGKYYCRGHFRDKKYGRMKDEDFHD